MIGEICRLEYGRHSAVTPQNRVVLSRGYCRNPDPGSEMIHSVISTSRIKLGLVRILVNKYTLPNLTLLSL